MADKMAAIGADMNAVPDCQVQVVRAARGKASLILQRLLAVNAHLIGKTEARSALHRPVRDPAMPTALQMAIDDSGHRFGTRPRYLAAGPPAYTCSACHQNPLRSGLLAFLASAKCPGDISLQSTSGVMLHGALRATTDVRVGRSELHRSHCLLTHRGLWWCSSCGFYTSAGDGKSSAKKLRSECRARTRAGSDYLAKLEKGCPPKNDMDWPLATDPCLGSMQPDGRFAAVPLTRLRSKATLTLDSLRATAHEENFASSQPSLPEHLIDEDAYLGPEEL